MIYTLIVLHFEEIGCTNGAYLFTLENKMINHFLYFHLQIGLSLHLIYCRLMD